MNTTHGAMPFPAATGSAVAIDPSPVAPPWPGLADAAARIGVSLDAVARDRFERYARLLLRGNSQFNLTAVRDRDGIERALFLNALAILPALETVAARSAPSGIGHVRLLDIGAGAGFPGLPLKIARPDFELTLIDATAKKTAFMNHVIAELGLERTRAVHGRAEEFGQNPSYREAFDIATARAVAALPILLEYVIPFLTVGGTAALPKGLEIDEELRHGRRAAITLGATISSADRLPVDGTRLIVATKVRATPSEYPRRVGLPSRSPLGQGM